jgi:hypothetical protein
MRGYRERERAIAVASAKLRRPRVIVLDLKKFYPSIPTPKALERFMRRLDRSGLRADEAELAVRCAEAICAPRKVAGIPIGPPLAHVLASIFLEDVDSKLAAALPGRYFRYVDDVALVVERAEARGAEKLFRDAIAAEGLETNDEKTDRTLGHVWRTRAAERREDGADRFGTLIRALGRYLAHNPEEFDDVRRLFRDEGFSLPFAHVRSVSRYRPFRYFAKRILRRLGLSSLFLRVNPVQLLQSAKAIRADFRERAERLREAEIPKPGIKRRWGVQELRFTFNRLLYLLPEEQRAEVLELLPDIPELGGTRAVYRALVAGKATELLHYPGPPVAAFAQLWRESHTAAPAIEWSTVTRLHERDSAITLGLYCLCQPPAEWIERFSSTPSQTALKLSASQHSLRRSYDDFSYIDEVESLLLGTEHDPASLLASRFDEGEDVFLPALGLGDGYAT